MGRDILRSIWDTIPKYESILFDDFWSYTDTQLWTKDVSDTTSTVAHAGDGYQSWLKLYTDTTDNHECLVHTTNEQFKFVTLQPIVVAARIKYSEASTNAAQVAFGFADAMTDDLISDTGAVGIGNEGALIYKILGETTWRFCTEMDQTNTSSTSTKTAGGTTAQVLMMTFDWLSSTVFEARPYVDGVQLIDSTSGDPICHEVTLGTATDMDLGFYLKTSTSGTAETLYVDWVYGSAMRT